jgi:hypothetical protein
MDMEKIESQLKNITPGLSMRESEVLWSRVEGGLTPRMAKHSKRSSRRSVFRIVTAGSLILGLLGSSVITAYASESLPGDTLYPAKITIERAQILLAPETKKKDLQLAFADRRVKEITQVLADVEEDTPSMEPALMAVTVPAPTEGAESAAMVSMETGEGAGAPTEPALMMMKVADTESLSSNDEHKDASLARMGTADAVALQSATPEATLMMAPSTQELQFNDSHQATTVERQKRKWKNLDSKKRALNVAIKELERAQKDLEESGAIQKSTEVGSVIVNLTELNDHGTTPDDTFIEKIQRNEIQFLRIDNHSSRGSDQSGNDHEGDVKSEDHTFAPPTSQHMLPQLQTASIGNVGDGDVKDIEQEIQEVHIQNEKRKKRQGDTGKSSHRSEGNQERIIVCRIEQDTMREISVQKDKVQEYLQDGFIEGKCPVAANDNQE